MRAIMMLLKPTPESQERRWYLSQLMFWSNQPKDK
jgi:hypothetical protein